MGSGVCQFACSIFCFVAAVILTIFWLITAGSDESDTNLTFMIVAIKHEWDLKEKSASCRNGAFIYYAISIGLGAWGYFLQRRAKHVAFLKKKAERRRAKDLKARTGAGMRGYQGTAGSHLNDGYDSSRDGKRGVGVEGGGSGGAKNLDSSISSVVSAVSVNSPLLAPMILGREQEHQDE